MTENGRQAGRRKATNVSLSFSRIEIEIRFRATIINRRSRMAYKRNPWSDGAFLRTDSRINFEEN